jgi:3-methyl-2-oxobutanoate hydroxymethyltransferase
MAGRLSIVDLRRMHGAGEKIAMLTAYDSAFARLCDGAGVDSLLVGDSLGMVVQGRDSTLAVTADEMAYHVGCVARSTARTFVIADMPFGAYLESPEQAMRTAAQFLAAGAQMVKLEGGRTIAPTIAFLVARGVPVCGHLGLTPQSVHRFGGYRVQGRDAAAADALIDDVRAVADAGAEFLVLEAIPEPLARRVIAATDMATIGIGASPACAGQVLVLPDMLDVPPGRKARFVRNFMQGAASIEGAVQAYVRAVKDGSFPAPEHCYPT